MALQKHGRTNNIIQYFKKLEINLNRPIPFKDILLLTTRAHEKDGPQYRSVHSFQAPGSL